MTAYHDARFFHLTSYAYARTRLRTRIYEGGSKASRNRLRYGLLAPPCQLSGIHVAMFRSTLLLLVCPLLVRAQYGFGPVTSSGEDGNSTSTQPLLADQSADLRAAGFILEYSLIGIVVETLLFGAYLVWFPE